MNNNYYKLWIHQTLEYLKRAHYRDWFKAYFFVNILLGSLHVIVMLISLLRDGPEGNFLTLVELGATPIIQASIKIIQFDVLAALVFTVGFRYIPLLFVAFILLHSILLSIFLATNCLKDAPLPPLIIGLLGAFFFTFSLLGLFVFFYCVIQLVIRSIKKRENSQKHSVNE
jgi:hypothetical protein